MNKRIDMFPERSAFDTSDWSAGPVCRLLSVQIQDWVAFYFWNGSFSSLSEKASSQDTNRLLHQSSAFCVPFGGYGCFSWPHLFSCLSISMQKKGVGRQGDSVCFISILVPCVQHLWLILIISEDLTAFHSYITSRDKEWGLETTPKASHHQSCGVFYLTKWLNMLINRRETCKRQGIMHTFPSL